MSRRMVNRVCRAWEQPSGVPLAACLWVFDAHNAGELSVFFQIHPDSKPVQWLFARELLHHGLANTSREDGDVGDVFIVLDPMVEQFTWMRIESDQGVAVFNLLTAELQAFLDETTALVALGDEDYDEAVDAFLAELLEEAS